MGFTRLPTPRETEIRVENRCVLHPQGKKRCTRCETVYDDIRANFDIHHRQKNGTISYAGQCKRCLAAVRDERVLRNKSSIETYAPKLLPGLRMRAKEQNLPFNLTVEHLVDVWYKQNALCYYTGEPLDLLVRTENNDSGHREMPSVDKLIPELGYVCGNIAWCRLRLNIMKNDLSEQEFLDMCRRVIEWNQNKSSIAVSGAVGHLPQSSN